MKSVLKLMSYSEGISPRFPPKQSQSQLLDIPTDETNDGRELEVDNQDPNISTSPVIWYWSWTCLLEIGTNWNKTQKYLYKTKKAVKNGNILF